MSLDLTFDELREANLKRCLQSYHPGGLSEWPTEMWFLAVTGELGEVATVIKHRDNGRIDSASAHGQLGDEIADVLIYLDLLAAREGIDLGEVVRRKFNATSAKIGSSVILYSHLHPEDGEAFLPGHGGRTGRE